MKNLPLVILALGVLSAGYIVVARREPSPAMSDSVRYPVNAALAAQFEVLQKSGNSSCSAAFTQSLPSMAAGTRLQGSCCSPMSLHRYSEQVEGLRKYAHVPEIPPDPYDVDAGLAKQLMALYDTQLAPDQQQAYDYAMAHSHEKGPCCCKCWRWYVYGGLGKLLITQRGFTGEQVTDVWNFSDGCGGDGEHHGHG